MLAACGAGNDPDPTQYGANPALPERQGGLLPSMEIAKPAQWGEQRPTVPQGYTITAIATDLKIPRQTLLLPNGDILVAEGRGGGAPKLRPKDFIAGKLKAKGNTTVESGDRLTLLRDADGDGTYELKTVFADDLDAPYGLALVGDALYVANQDALVRFDYRAGQTRASGKPVQAHRPAVGDQPPLDQGAGRQSGWPLPVRRHRFQQQHHRARHAGRSRSRDGVAGRCADRRAQAVCHRPAQSHRARVPARHRHACGRW